MALVDVVVPCYQYGAYLRECVDSILGQSLRDLRVLIIDDASTDETPEVARALERADRRVSVSTHEKNRGIIATLNEGLEWASGDYVLIISADDLLFPGALQRAVELMESHPTVSMTCGRAIPVRGAVTPGWENQPQDSGYRILSGKAFLDANSARNIVCAPTAVVRTRIQKKVGGYRPELPHAADFEMWLRLAAHGDVGVLRAFQAVYRIHGTNFSLAYAEQGGLPDLQQRRLAIDCFIEACRDVLPDADARRDRMRRLLGLDALRRAGDALNRGDTAVAEQLRRFAAETSPGVQWSIPGAKLAFKRALGTGAWRAVEPAARGLGRAARRLADMVSPRRHEDIYSQ